MLFSQWKATGNFPVQGAIAEAIVGFPSKAGQNLTLSQ